MNKNTDSNIISDEEFLKEIFSDQKAPVQTATPQSDIDDILLGKESNEEEEKTDEGEDTEDLNKPKDDSENDDKKVEEEEILLEEKSTLRRFGVKDTVSSLIENDTWVDMPIKYGDKEYDNITELLEKEKPSKELFDQLSAAQKKYREDIIKEEYVKVGDKDSTKAKLVNAILHDIDYTDLLEYNKEVVEPLQRIDFAQIQNGDKIAEAFVRQCLVEIDNYHPDSIEAVVEKLKTDFRLIDKAEEYQKVTIDNFNREIEKRELEKVESVKRDEEVLKQNVKNLKEELKNQGISDKFANQILKLRYTKDEKGKFHYESLIQDKLKDKSFEAKLIHFLLDEEDFLDKAKSKVKTETSKKYMELVNITPKEKGAKESPKGGNLQTDDEELLAELGIKL